MGKIPISFPKLNNQHYTFTTPAIMLSVCSQKDNEKKHFGPYQCFCKCVCRHAIVRQVVQLL